MLDVITRARLPAGIREANLSMKGRRRDLVNLRTIAVNFDVVTKLTGLSVDLDAVVEVLLERGTVEKTVACGARKVDDVLRLDGRLVGGGLGGLHGES